MDTGVATNRTQGTNLPATKTTENRSRKPEAGRIYPAFSVNSQQPVVKVQWAAFRAPREQMQGSATQAMRGHRRGALTQQMLILHVNKKQYRPVLFLPASGLPASRLVFFSFDPNSFLR